MEEMKTILVVEDDFTLNNGIKFVLQNSKQCIKQAFNVVEAEDKFNQSIDLILLDINLPDGNGVDFCMHIREQSTVPIIFISANDTDNDIIKGLELGGDDYIVKPFNLMVLRARVEAVIRRYEEGDNENIYRSKDYFFDFENMVYLRMKRLYF